MGRKFRDITTVNQVKVRQKNGDTYVYEREYKYNPATKRNERLSNKLIGKVPAGTTEMVPTRNKKPSGTKQQRGNPTSPAAAARTRAVLTEILDWAALESGIEADLLEAMCEGDAQKTASLARFWTVTKNGTIPDVVTWQITHPIPYREGLSADVCYKLFTDLGIDESARQSLFLKRAERLGDHPMIAYDSTTVSTWSEMLKEARYGFNKDRDGRKTVKYLMLYAVDTMQPVAFAKQCGNLPDVTSIGRAMAQLAVLGVSKPQLVTDCGYYSEHNLAELCWANFDFITLTKPCRWINEIVEEVRGSIQEPQNADPDSEVFVKTVRMQRDFVRIRQRGSQKKHLKAGDPETFRRTLYIHVCFNPVTKAAEDQALLAESAVSKSFLSLGGHSVSSINLQPAMQNVISLCGKRRQAQSGPSVGMDRPTNWPVPSMVFSLSPRTKRNPGSKLCTGTDGARRSKSSLRMRRKTWTATRHGYGQPGPSWGE